MVANRLDLNRARLFRLVNDGLEMPGQLPFVFRRGVAGLGATGFGFVAEQEDVLRLAPEVELLAVNHAIAGGAVLGPALDILERGVGDGLPELGEQAGLVERVLEARATDDVEGLLASAEGFGIARLSGGAEHGLGFLELAGLDQVQSVDHHLVPGGEGEGDGGGFGGKARGERSRECEDQTGRNSGNGFHIGFGRAHHCLSPWPICNPPPLGQGNEARRWVCTSCWLEGKKHGGPDGIICCARRRLRLCCQHGLAAVGVVGGSCLRSGVAAGEQVSPAQVQFRAGHALRLCCRPGIVAAKFDCLSRAQRRSAPKCW